jgi:hypothetical protein
MEKKEVMKSILEKAWDRLDKKEELLEVISAQAPEMTEEERLAFAKIFAYTQEIKKSEKADHEITQKEYESKYGKPKKNTTITGGFHPHKSKVETALNSGKKVPEHVLKDYPELSVKKSEDKGVHKPHKGFGIKQPPQGNSVAGDNVRNAAKHKAKGNKEVYESNLNTAKKIHSKKLNELKEIKPNLPKSELQKGKVEQMKLDLKKPLENKGVNRPSKKNKGQSFAGIATREGDKKYAKKVHQNTLQELKQMPKPNLPKSENMMKDEDGYKAFLERRKKSDGPGSRSNEHHRKQIAEGKKSPHQAQYKERPSNPKGVHNKASGIKNQGTSEAGAYVKGNKAKARDYDFNPESRKVQLQEAKKEHKKVLAEQKAMPKPNLPKSEMAKSNEKGVHIPLDHKDKKGKSHAGLRQSININSKRGEESKNKVRSEIKDDHKRVLTEARNIKPNLPKSEMAKRCWDGYKPVEGKKPYSKGSCEKIKKSEEVIELYKYNDGTAELVWTDGVSSKQLDYIVKSELNEWDEVIEKKESFDFKKEHKSDKGGLTEKGRKAYNKATGSNLKKPQPEGGKRKKSYCARSKGQMKDHNVNCQKTPEKRICLARKRWKC